MMFTFEGVGWEDESVSKRRQAGFNVSSWTAISFIISSSSSCYYWYQSPSLQCSVVFAIGCSSCWKCKYILIRTSRHTHMRGVNINVDLEKHQRWRDRSEVGWEDHHSRIAYQQGTALESRRRWRWRWRWEDGRVDSDTLLYEGRIRLQVRGRRGYVACGLRHTSWHRVSLEKTLENRTLWYTHGKQAHYALISTVTDSSPSSSYHRQSIAV